MDIFIPFIHDREKQEIFEPLPLYIDDMPYYEKDEEDEEDDYNRGIIILKIT